MENVTDRRVLKTQRALKEAFVELLSSKDFDDLSVKTITEHANVGRKTFYLHYLDKYDLMDAVLTDYFDELDHACSANSDLSYDKKAKIWFDFFYKYQLFFSKLFLSKGSYSFRGKLLEFTETQLFKKGEFKSSDAIKIRFLSFGVTGIIESFVLKQISQDILAVSKQVSKLVSDNINS